jgi:hypothetical protein
MHAKPRRLIFFSGITCNKERLIEVVAKKKGQSNSNKQK